MQRRPCNAFGKASLFLMPVVLAIVFSSTSYAIPAFSRMYGTSCSTCHLDFPQLNDFGKAFKDAGFKFPKDDESMIKIPPVMLGAPANAELWPKAIWPGTIPGIPPIGFRMTNYLQFTGRQSQPLRSAHARRHSASVCPDCGLRDRLVQPVQRGQFRWRHCFLGGQRHQRQRRQFGGGTGRGLSQVRQYRPPTEAAAELPQPAGGTDGTGTAFHRVQVDLDQSLRYLYASQYRRDELAAPAAAVRQ